MGPVALAHTIARNPWSSLLDALVLSGVMVFAYLLAYHYDIVGFLNSLTYKQQPISPAEWVMLAMLLVICVGVFVERRAREEQFEILQQIGGKGELGQLRALAMQDPLTELPNRRALLAALDALAETEPPEGRIHALFVLDLNGFKDVNDLHGHTLGDEVLRVVVERFGHACRADDVLARLGGDEFAVVVQAVTRDEAGEICQRYIDAVREDIKVDGVVSNLGVAIGVAFFPEDGVGAHEILRHADLAMYRAKKSAPKSGMAFFNASVDVPGPNGNV